MPFFVDGEEVQSNREIMEALKDYGDFMTDTIGRARCPMCGCTLGYGAYDHGYGDYAEVEFCYSEACDYEEYV